MASADTNELFGGLFYYCKIDSVSGENISSIYDLEVCSHPVNSDIRIVALGRDSISTNHWIINLEDWNTGNANGIQYQVSTQSSWRLHGIAQTNKYFSIEYTLPGTMTDFGLITYYKQDFHYLDSRRYYLPNHVDYDDRYPNDIISNDYYNNQIYLLLKAQGPLTTDTSYKGINIALYGIDIENNMSNFCAQAIPTNGKPYNKSATFDNFKKELYFVANMDLTPLYNITATDIICTLDLNMTQNYFCNITIPNNNASFQDRLNSITMYDNNQYYMVAGTSQTALLYWFDKKTTPAPSSCHNDFGITAHIISLLPNSTGAQTSYNFYTTTKQPFLSQSHITKYSTIRSH